MRYTDAVVARWGTTDEHGNAVEAGRIYEGQELRCALCNKVPMYGALWSDFNTLVVCRDCAVTTLPCMIADAALDNDPSQNPAEIEQHMVSRFRKAVAHVQHLELRTIREREENTTTQEDGL